MDFGIASSLYDYHRSIALNCSQLGSPLRSFTLSASFPIASRCLTPQANIYPPWNERVPLARTFTAGLVIFPNGCPRQNEILANELRKPNLSLRP